MPIGALTIIGLVLSAGGTVLSAIGTSQDQDKARKNNNK
mgnify:CR=1 FL=1